MRRIGILLAVASLILALAWPGDLLLAEHQPDPGPAVCAGAPEPNVFRIAAGRPLTLDPAVVRTGQSGLLAELLFSGLVGVSAAGEVEGDLAAGWTVSGDGRIYTFNLRPAAAFADGRQIAAADVVFSIARALAPATRSPVALTYLGDIKGASEFNRGNADSLTGVVALGEGTLQIELTERKAAFLQKLTYPTSFVVDSSEVDVDGWWRDPNSSGAFSLVKLPGLGDEDPVVVTPNRNHHFGATSSLIRAEFHAVGSQTAYIGYQSGEFDAIFLPGLRSAQVSDPTHRLHSHYRTTDAIALSYLGFRSKTAPFDDPLVRRAFSHAIDVDRLNRVLGLGLEMTADGIIPPAIPGYEAGSAGAPAYDPALARQLLAESSYGSAEALGEIVFSSVGRSLGLDRLEWAIANMLEENLGVAVVFRSLSFGELLNLLDGPTNPKLQMYVLAWFADYLDPENFVEALFGSNSPVNSFEYSSAKVDELIDLAELRPLGEDREALYRAAERQILADAAILPLTFGVDHLLVQPWVADLHYGRQFDWLSRLSIDDQVCPA